MTTLKHGFLDRVVRERNELNIKTERLGHFIGGVVYNSLTGVGKTLLDRQWYHMQQYLNILDRRISNFDADMEPDDTVPYEDDSTSFDDMPQPVDYVTKDDDPCGR